MEYKLYFAYGSNTNIHQMEYRCPDAEIVGPVKLEGYELLFRGNTGGRGVATIAPKEGSFVQGVLWEITPQCEQTLNKFEGWPALYGKELVTVQNRKGEEFTVMAYVMTDLYRREPVIPSPSYFCTIKDGFRQNGLLLRPLNRALKHCQEEVQAMYDINFDTIKKISCPPKKRVNKSYER